MTNTLPGNEVRPFKISVSDSDLADLRTRLHNTRWPEAELVPDWSQGTPLAWVKDMCTYWADQYDWRAREELLNRFDHNLTTIDGVDVHFVRMTFIMKQNEPFNKIMTSIFRAMTQIPRSGNRANLVE